MNWTDIRTHPVIGIPRIFVKKIKSQSVVEFINFRDVY